MTIYLTVNIPTHHPSRRTEDLIDQLRASVAEDLGFDERYHMVDVGDVGEGWTDEGEDTEYRFVVWFKDHDCCDPKFYSYDEPGFGRGTVTSSHPEDWCDGSCVER